MSAECFNPDAWLPKNRSRFRLDEIAKFLSVTVQHLFNLTVQRELRVPRKAVKSAPSRASIMVTRRALVSFLKRRSSLERCNRKEERAKRPVSASTKRQSQSASRRRTKRRCNGFATQEQPSQ